MGRSDSFEPSVKWVQDGENWILYAGRKSWGRWRWRTVANVWKNSPSRATWHTWDYWGVGGENDVEDSVEIAKVEAAASVIAQGFI